MADNQAENITEVVLDGLRFLESLTRHYGVERGMEMWDKFGEIMGPEVKAQVFLGLLTGETTARVRFQRGRCNEAVAAIKAIRLHTGMSLSAAKNAYDLSVVQVVTVECLGRNDKHELIRALNNLNILIV